METGRFDTNSSSKVAKKFRSFQVKFAIEQEKSSWVNILRGLRWYEYRKTAQNYV